MIRDINKAKQLGFTYYHTERRCKHGHYSPRYTSTKACVTCANIWRIERKRLNPERAKEYFREYDQKRFPDRKAYYRQYYLDNRRRIDRRVAANPKSKAIKASANSRRKEVIKYANLYPNDQALQLKIQKIYEQMSLMRREGSKVCVDHIIPIVSKTVCGLHAPWNMRIIDQGSNIRKSNRYSQNHNFLGLKKKPSVEG